MENRIKRAGLDYSVESVLSSKTQADFIAEKYDEINWIEEGKPRRDFLASIYREAKAIAKTQELK